jgi:hypothetical protein
MSHKLVNRQLIYRAKHECPPDFSYGEYCQVPEDAHYNDSFIPICRACWAEYDPESEVNVEE